MFSKKYFIITAVFIFCFSTISYTQIDTAVVKEIEDNTAVVQYQLKKVLRPLYYQIRLEAIANQVTYPLSEPMLEGEFGIISSKYGQRRKIIWNNIDATICEGKDINILVKADLCIDCGIENKPQMKKLAYYIFGTLGIGSMATAIKYKRSAEGHYNNYLIAKDATAAAELYKKANQNRHLYLALQNGGIGLLSTSAIWFITRSVKHKKRLKIFNQYCLSLPPTNLTGSTNGIQLAWMF